MYIGLVAVCTHTQVAVCTYTQAFRISCCMICLYIYVYICICIFIYVYRISCCMHTHTGFAARAVCKNAGRFTVESI